VTSIIDTTRVLLTKNNKNNSNNKIRTVTRALAVHTVLYSTYLSTLITASKLSAYVEPQKNNGVNAEHTQQQER